MGEKKSSHNTILALVLFVLFWGGILLILTGIRVFQSGNLVPLIHSWILITSRGYSGDASKIVSLDAKQSYISELTGDAKYRKGDREGAILDYRTSLTFEPNSYIELKLALLQVEKSQSVASDTKTLSGSNTKPLEESKSRIEQDSLDRTKYFSEGRDYSSVPQIFQREEGEIINW